MGEILKIIANLGKLSSDLSDFEKAAKDLFSGSFTEADANQLIIDLQGILTSGLINIDGIDLGAVAKMLSDGEIVGKDIIAAVKDLRSNGVASLPPDASKVVSDLAQFINDGVIQNFGGFTKQQAQELLQSIASAL